MGLRLRYNSHRGKGKFIFKYWNDLTNEGGENNVEINDDEDSM